MKTFKIGHTTINSNYNPLDYDEDGIADFVAQGVDDLYIIDGKSFLRKFTFKPFYVYGIDTIRLSNYCFYGYYDINGSGKRKAILWSLEWGYCIVNLQTNSIELTLGKNDSYAGQEVFSPAFIDINNDGHIEMITTTQIIGRSATPVAIKSLPLSKQSNVSLQSYPNPISSIAKIDYNVPKAGVVNISIFDASGRLVRRLVEERKSAGNFTATWNGKGDNGEALASGEYYYDVKIGDVGAMKKVILMK
jgi:hypothetical protein